MDTRTYNCTPAQLASLTSMFAQADVTVNFAQAGETVEKGWDVAWTFPTSNTVAITVKKHPFGEENFLWTRLDKMFSTNSVPTTTVYPPVAKV